MLASSFVGSKPSNHLRRVGDLRSDGAGLLGGR
jgi:hypothetical protein